MDEVLPDYFPILYYQQPGQQRNTYIFDNIKK